MATQGGGLYLRLFCSRFLPRDPAFSLHHKPDRLYAGLDINFQVFGFGQQFVFQFGTGGVDRLIGALDGMATSVWQNWP